MLRYATIAARAGWPSAGLFGGSNSTIEAPTDIERGDHRRQRRHRMKQTGGRLRAEFGCRRFPHKLQVARHVRVVVAGRVGWQVPAVIARVEDDDLKVRKEAAPEADIPVARKAVAVADDQPRPARIAVPPYADGRAAVRGWPRRPHSRRR
jgi:hypothetical protein